MKVGGAIVDFALFLPFCKGQQNSCQLLLLITRPQHSPLNTLESSSDAERNLLGFLWGGFFTLLLTAPFLLTTRAESSDDTSPALLSITDKSLILRDAFVDSPLSGFNFWHSATWSCTRMSVTEFDLTWSSPSGSKLLLLLLLRLLSRPTRRRAAISEIFRVLAKTGLTGVTGLYSSFLSSMTDDTVVELRSLSPSSVKLRSFLVLLGVGKGCGELEHKTSTPAKYCHYGFHEHQWGMSRNYKTSNRLLFASNYWETSMLWMLATGGPLDAISFHQAIRT